MKAKFKKEKKTVKLKQPKFIFGLKMATTDSGGITIIAVKINFIPYFEYTMKSKNQPAAQRTLEAHVQLMEGVSWFLYDISICFRRAQIPRFFV